jgi:hypothetical protein
MREHVLIATLLALLAVVGIEPGHAQSAKTCRTGAFAALIAPC